jgi:hypothetical protein
MALHNIGSQQISGGAFRRNLRRIIEQCEIEHQSFKLEFFSLLNEFCVQIDHQNWKKPDDEGTRIVFEARLKELNETLIHIKGDAITESDLDLYKVSLSPIDEILLSKWLIVSSQDELNSKEVKQCHT